MNKHSIYTFGLLVALAVCAQSCKIPAIVQPEENHGVPGAYGSRPGATDTTNVATHSWRDYFTDPYLVDLIDTALQNNQELQITLQDIEIARNDVGFRKGQLLPSVEAAVGVGVDKVGRYTSQGAGDASTDITPGREVPDPLMDYTAGLYAHWEVDIWKKLHNAKKAAVSHYLSTVEGKNFVLTNLIAEVADTYYELRGLDNALAIVRDNIALQQHALEVIQVQKDAARATELAVQKFHAEVLNSQAREFEIRQQITETENKLNFLLGRYPQEIPRDTSDFSVPVPSVIPAGIPSQLLANRPDIKKAELELAAAKLDVKVARAEFYPSFDISAAIGFDAFDPSYLVKFPESMLYTLAGDLAGPLINRSGIKAEFKNANARQIQAMVDYERTILNAYLEVSNELSNVGNLEKQYNLKAEEVATLELSIDLSNDLFRSARADYLEVLMTQRDALESKLELVETRTKQLSAIAQVYRDLGGGWH